MKTRLLIIIGIVIIGVIVASTVGTMEYQSAYNQNCNSDGGYVVGFLKCIYINEDFGEKLGSDCRKIFGKGTTEMYDCLEKIEKVVPSSETLSWCADKFDQTKYEFQQSLEEYTCDNPICPESEPPLFSSALNSDEEFIEKGCAKFVDKWAYMTEDNDYTWHSIYWESFVKHHYESDPFLDPQRNEKCAELFDLIMRSAEDSDLWYEITETNDFRDAKCASIVSEWEYLTKHDVWNIGISWDNVVENANVPSPINQSAERDSAWVIDAKDELYSLGCDKPILEYLYRSSNLLDDDFDGNYFQKFIGLPDGVSKEKFEECVEFILEKRMPKDDVKSTQEHYAIEITGLKDVYIVGERYDFSYIISGYGNSCGSKTVTFPDSSGDTIGSASSASCIANLPMGIFVFDIQKEQGTTYGHVEIKNPGTYTVTVTFDRPSQYFPTIASQEFRVVEE